MHPVLHVILSYLQKARQPLAHMHTRRLHSLQLNAIDYLKHIRSC